MIYLVIPGKPLGKQRHQTAIRGKGENTFTHEYTPAQTVNYETLVRLAFMDKYPNHAPWERNVPLISLIEAFYPMPMSFNEAARRNALAGITFPCVKPDSDNIEKIMWDSLNQVAYADDAQIVKNQCSKFFSDKPRTEIKLMTIEDWLIVRDL